MARTRKALGRYLSPSWSCWRLSLPFRGWLPEEGRLSFSTGIRTKLFAAERKTAERRDDSASLFLNHHVLSAASELLRRSFSFFILCSRGSLKKIPGDIRNRPNKGRSIMVSNFRHFSVSLVADCSDMVAQRISRLCSRYSLSPLAGDFSATVRPVLTNNSRPLAFGRYVHAKSRSLRCVKGQQVFTLFFHCKAIHRHSAQIT